MALPISGRLSLADIQGEFGGTAPTRISEYYGADTGVPASGRIAISDFHGKSSGPPQSTTLTFTAGVLNLDSGPPSYLRFLYSGVVSNYASFSSSPYYGSWQGGTVPVPMGGGTMSTPVMFPDGFTYGCTVCSVTYTPDHTPAMRRLTISLARPGVTSANINWAPFTTVRIRNSANTIIESFARTSAGSNNVNFAEITWVFNSVPNNWELKPAGSTFKVEFVY